MSRVTSLNDATFDESIIKTSGLVVVLFWVSWCGHCNSIITAFEELSNEMQNIVFVLINKDEGTAIADRFDVESVPSMLFLKDGKMVYKILGSYRKEKLREIILATFT